jgi:hypothetical protein
MNLGSGKPVLDGLYQQLLKRGVQYFLPSSQIETVRRVSESTPQIVFLEPGRGGFSFEWMGNCYAVTNHRGSAFWTDAGT